MRTEHPRRDLYFYSHLDAANALLNERLGVEAVSGDAFLSACLAAGDVCWQRADPERGAILELGLDPHHGRPCSNIWAAILKGEASLREPTPPDPLRRQQVERGPARTYQQNPDGSFRVVGDYESLW